MHSPFDSTRIAELTWKQAVAECALQLVNERSRLTFTIDDMYRYLPQFSERFPGNRFPKQKMRQSLQKLRTDGFLRFGARGQYRLNAASDELQSDVVPPLEGGIEVPETKAVVRNIRLRNTVLAIEIKRRYGNVCQICRAPVWLTGGSCYAEGHHLRPLGAPHCGPDKPGNIIVLCPNHHVMFDRGAATIVPRTRAVLHAMSGVFDDSCKVYVEPWHKIDERWIEYHHRQIFRAA